MKQQISIEQLQELTDEQKDKLFAWWIPKYQPGDHFVVGPNTYIVGQEYGHTHYLMPTHFKHPVTYPLLSIGQMIELFTNRIKPSENNRPLIYVIDDIWNVEAVSTGSWGDNHVWTKSTELCDALWEAVKMLL